MTRAEIEVKTKVYITYDENREDFEGLKKIYDKREGDDYLVFLSKCLLKGTTIEQHFAVEKIVIVHDDFDLVDEMKVDE